MTDENLLSILYHMESVGITSEFGEVARVTAHSVAPRILVVCEHASNRVPAKLNGLGLDDETLGAHVAWDPGALGVAEEIARQLEAVLVQGGASRLVYDCNRPPEAESAVPVSSEVYDIPGNAGLSAEARAERVAQVYEPFRQALAAEIARRDFTTMVTVHSFTPVYNGAAREVEIGLLHGKDAALAKAMMANLPDGFVTRLNEPYAACDGVVHTLDLHGAANGLANVMIEVRNDLICTAEQQKAMADILVPWIAEAAA